MALPRTITEGMPQVLLSVEGTAQLIVVPQVVDMQDMVVLVLAAAAAMAAAACVNGEGGAITRHRPYPFKNKKRSKRFTRRFK